MHLMCIIQMYRRGGDNMMKECLIYHHDEEEKEEDEFDIEEFLNTCANELHDRV